jgi:predicted PurR-regulated permease PerM
MNDSRPRWPFQVKLMVSLLMLALILYLLSRFNQVIAPFVLAIILSFILSPIVNLFQVRLHFKRGLAILLTYLLLIAFSIIVPISIYPLISSQIEGLNLDLQKILQSIQNFLRTRYQIGGQVIDTSALFDQLTGALQGVVEPFVGQTLNLVIEVISSAV